MNAFIIEYVSYLKRTKKRHIIGLSIFILLMSTIITIAIYKNGGEVPK